MVEELTNDFFKFHSQEWVEDLRAKIYQYLEGAEKTKENVQYAMQSILWSEQNPSFKYD